MTRAIEMVVATAFFLLLAYALLGREPVHAESYPGHEERQARALEDIAKSLRGRCR